MSEFDLDGHSAQNSPTRSRVSGRLHSLYEAISGCDVVSFDVFDTLLYRLISAPEVVFDLIGQRHSIYNFRAIREASQVQAFSIMNAEGRREITLEQIYACMPALSSSREELMADELRLESELLRPNPEMCDLLRSARVSGKRVVLTSDMYLSGKFVGEICSRHGISYDELFVSCDYQATKRDDGALFRLLIEKCRVPPERVVHIGDNPHSDLRRGAEQGLRTFLYAPERAVAAPPPTTLCRGIVGGVILAQNYREHSIWRRYGYAYGAPPTLAMLLWLKAAARSDGVDAMLFLTRDGFALHKLWEDVWASEADLPPGHYFRASRTSLTLASIDDDNFEEHIPFLLSGAEGLKLGDIFERIGVEAPSDRVLEDLGLSLTAVFDAASRDTFTTLLRAWRRSIVSVCAACRAGFHSYLLSIGLKDGMTLGVVDVGWRGTTQIALEKALRPFVDVKVQGYYLCLAVEPSQATDNIESNMKALISRRRDPLATDVLYENRVVVELFFSASHASLIGYRRRGDGSVEFIEDSGRGADPRIPAIADEINTGIWEGVSDLLTAFNQLAVEPHLPSLLAPLVRLAGSPTQREVETIGGIYNFDAWASSAAHRHALVDPQQSNSRGLRGDAWSAGQALSLSEASAARTRG